MAMDYIKGHVADVNDFQRNLLSCQVAAALPPTPLRLQK